jgi:hypothetical protein
MSCNEHRVSFSVQLISLDVVVPTDLLFPLCLCFADDGKVVEVDYC